MNKQFCAHKLEINKASPQPPIPPPNKKKGTKCIAQCYVSKRLCVYYKTFLSFISQLLNNVLFSFFFLFSSSTLSHYIIFIRYLFLLSSPFSLSLSLSLLSVSCCCFFILFLPLFPFCLPSSPYLCFSSVSLILSRGPRLLVYTYS